MPILIISKKYAKIRKFGTKISPPICNLWGKIFFKNFYFYLYILYSNLELWEKQNNFWWIRLLYIIKLYQQNVRISFLICIKIHKRNTWVELTRAASPCRATCVGISNNKQKTTIEVFKCQFYCLVWILLLLFYDI